MRFLFFLFILVSNSCRTTYFPKEFHGLKWKVDCDTVLSTYWIKFAAVNVFPKTVFSDVKIFYQDTTFSYQIKELRPPIDSYSSRLYRRGCYFVVRKRDCRLVRYEFFRH